MNAAKLQIEYTSVKLAKAMRGKARQDDLDLCSTLEKKTLQWHRSNIKREKYILK